MIKSVRISICLTLVVVLFTTSCSSIFEDRNKCPANLILDCSLFKKEINKLDVWIEDASGIKKYRYDLIDETSPFFIIPVVKGDVKCYVWGNLTYQTQLIPESKLLTRTKLLKRETSLCDSLFFYTTSKYINADTSVVILHPYKQFATIHLTVKNYDYYTKMLARLSSNSNGFYFDGAIHSGSSLSVKEVLNGRCQLRLLRQNSISDIMLYLDYTYELISRRFIFNLGDHLKSLNYDMTAVNLSDIDIEIDMAKMVAFISIRDWDKVFSFDIEI